MTKTLRYLPVIIVASLTAFIGCADSVAPPVAEIVSPTTDGPETSEASPESDAVAEDEPTASTAKATVEFVKGDEFKTTLSDNEIVVVDFTATWCAPCQVLKPHLKKLASGHPDAKFVMVDCTEGSDLQDEYEVEGLPTILVFKSGKEAKRIEGFKDDGSTIEVIRTAITNE